ncbi:MAG TPA: hypothetical protein GX403_08145 [Rhodocyclaceae bacterium]|nr:hypothetical protein [Rhodocyclaceae bacterium]
MDYDQPAACLDALQRLHPIDYARTHETLSRIVQGLLASRPAPNQHLEVLEAARDTLNFAQGEMARAYTAHPLPPSREAERVFDKVVGLWQAMARSYAAIAEADAREGTLEDQRALLAQRRICYEGLALMEYFRSHRALPVGMWRAVHRSYQDAVREGLARVRVADTLNEVWRAQSPHEAYVAVLLVELANPYGRSERELNWVMRWAQRFAPYCALDTNVEGQKPGAYGVDTDSDCSLRPLGLLARTPGLLRFDGSTLAIQIQAVLAQFKRGVKPAALGLGEDCSASVSARLLLSLYRPWGLASSGRRFPRRARGGRVELTGDWLAIGFALNGELFQQPRASATPRGRLSDDMSLLTFGERVPRVTETKPAAPARAHPLAFESEQWEVLDQSVSGFRLQRPSDGVRLEHHQLIGIRPLDADQLLIADLSWLMYRSEGMLEVGVNVLPGVPRVVSVRPQAQTDGREPFHQAFLLPPSPALKSDGSLVLPPMWFRPGRLVELREGDAVREVCLRKLLLRGTNFDQCSFEPAGQLNPA